MKNLRTLKSVKSAQPSFPLNFSVNTENNGDRSPVIYIENFENAHDLIWDVSNEGSEDLHIEAITVKPEDITNYHFQLKFRPGTLSDNFILKVIYPYTEEEVKWESQLYKDKESKIVYMNIWAQKININEGKLALNRTVPLQFLIKQVNANPVGGARNTNVEFLFQNILNSNNSDNKLKGNRMQHLGVVNHQGVRSIPLIVETIGNATILNTEVDNDLVVQISNYSNKNIPFSTDPNNATKIELIIYFPMDNESGSIFLASKEDLNRIRFDWINKADWTVNGRTETSDAFVWTVTNKAQTLLPPGESINFGLNDVKTNLPEGTAKIQINYFNIPGFWDGTLYVDITKSPIDFKNKFVGIHTNEPKHVLDVRGGTIGTNRITITNQHGEEYSDNWIGMANNVGDSMEYLHIGGIRSGEGNMRRIVLVADIIKILGELVDGKGPIMPRGAIILWSGSKDNIPPGWHLCNGEEGTPNLMDRFVVGAGNEYTANDSKGGIARQTLTVEQLPSHSHNGTTDQSGIHNHNINFSMGDVRASWSSESYWPTNPAHRNNGSWEKSTDNGGEHSHSFTTNHTGGGQAFDNRPPYYALCYIMKL